MSRLIFSVIFMGLTTVAPGQAREYTTIQLPSPVWINAGYPFTGLTRVLGVNAKGEVLLHDCRHLWDGEPCRAYLWSQKDGLQPVDMNLCAIGSCSPSSGTPPEILLNDRGEVGGHVLSNVVVWSAQHGTQNLGTAGLSYLYPPIVAFNNRGEVAGNGYTSTGSFDGFFASEKGGIRYLCPKCFVAGINDRSEVVGRGQGAFAFYWSEKDDFIDINPAGAVTSGAIAISNEGVVLASMTDANSTLSYFLWEKRRGLLYRIPLPASCRARGLTSFGQVLANCESPSQVWIWSPSTGARQVESLGYDAIAFRQNQSGEVVGQSRVTPTSPYHAFVWSPSTGTIDLDSSNPTRESQAKFIGDDGTIGGFIGGQTINHTETAPSQPTVWVVKKH
jgi:hypothetical protein